MFRIFFFNDTATTEIYTLSLHDALPICPGEARTAHPPASRREDSSREGPVWQALSGHKRSNTLAAELPPQARGTGTLIPSVRRLVWAGKHQLGNAAWGASFP